MSPWITTEHVLGFLLGLALAAWAIDHGMRQPTQTLPPPPTVFLAP